MSISCCDFLLIHFLSQSITDIWNMAHQHSELYLRLDDVEKLRRYAQSTASKHHTLKDDLDKAKARSKHWEWKAKEGINRIMGAEKERDEDKEEAHITQLASIADGVVKVWVEDNLARVQDALVVAKEARRKVEVEVASLEIEQTSLLLEAGARV